MRKDPSEEGMRWLEQAKEDLVWTKDLAERGGYHIACFLAQQVGGKALKAFAYAQGEEIVLGHSVERLCHLAIQWEPRSSELVKRWAILDSYYVTTRYPNSIPARVYTQNVAREAVQLASEIVNFVDELIKPAEERAPTN